MPFKNTLLHKLGQLNTHKSTNCTEPMNTSSIATSGDVRNSAGGSNNAELEEGELKTANAESGTNVNAYGFFTRAAQAISLTMGADHQYYAQNVKENLKPMKHSIRISKQPKNLEDPRLRCRKLDHLGALKRLNEAAAPVEQPIDEKMMARIQGVVFKHLRPRSI